MASNFYETLGLSMTAAEVDIAATLDRELGKASNLQRIPLRRAEAEARGQALEQIRLTLLDPTKRLKYDAHLAAVERDRPRIGFSAPERTSIAPRVLLENPTGVFCTACGRPVRNLAKFCAGCGNETELAASAVAQVIGTHSPTLLDPITPMAVPCPGCGLELELFRGKIYCSRCGVYTVAAQAGANAAAVMSILPLYNNPSQLSHAGSTPPVIPNTRAVTAAWSNLSRYYQDEFRKIEQSGESYKGKWNWAAFFFGFIWALTKGLWVLFLITLVLSIVTGGVAGVVFWFIFGARGNYMYYCAEAKNRQLPF